MNSKENDEIDDMEYLSGLNWVKGYWSCKGKMFQFWLLKAMRTTSHVVNDLVDEFYCSTLRKSHLLFNSHQW